MRATGLRLIGSTLLAAACSTGSADDEATTTQSVTETDLALAQAAATILSADGSKCTECHTAGKTDVKRWGAAFTAVEAACLAPTLTLTAQQRIDCLRKDPTNPASPFAARKLGLYAAGAWLPELEALFKAAYPEGQWEAKYAAFKTKAAMPALNRPGLTAAEWATVKRWAARGLPKIDEVMQQPGSEVCQPSTTPELLAHIDTMKVDGWGARLAAASTPMAGCGAETDPLKCLKTFPDITATWGAEGTPQTLREMRKLAFETSFWSRSSPDGRFASFGGSPSRVIDLNAPASAAPVTVAAPYDPGYFPNNDGFSFAGTNAGGIRVCKTSVLRNAFTTTHNVTLTEPGCSKMLDTVYQSVGAALDGSLFFMATGEHTNDAGSEPGPISGDFGASSTTTLTPMFNDGTKYVAGTNVSVRIPNEGDQQLSPSNSLLITRFGDAADKAGYRIRKLTAHVTAAHAVTVDTKVLGTVCIPGGKPQLSFDERFMAVHQYMDPAANPSHLPEDTSNIFLVDVKTGKQVQITRMKKGQHALYPHWRADGWLYFLVRDDNTNKETFVATDAALRVPR